VQILEKVTEGDAVLRTLVSANSIFALPKGWRQLMYSAASTLL